LYEVVAEDTSEEGISARRKGEERRNEPRRSEGNEGKRGSLRVVYGGGKGKVAKAAEQLEIRYSTEKGNVTDGFTDSSSQRGGNYSQEVED
jgi:hypothetical protein